MKKDWGCVTPDWVKEGYCSYEDYKDDKNGQMFLSFYNPKEN